MPLKFTRDIDRIRIRPRAEHRAEPVTHVCAWEGCKAPAPHRAPQSPERLRDYYWFCTGHVREYNQRWNFFAGKSDTEVEDYIRDNITGHRPTWRNRDSGVIRKGWSYRQQDRYNLFGDPSEPAKSNQPQEPAGRRLPAAMLEAFASLGLEQTASLKDIKVRYKELVKRFHPDANGGDRATEGKLKQVIQAYNRLKASNIK